MGAGYRVLHIDKFTSVKPRFLPHLSALALASAFAALSPLPVPAQGPGPVLSPPGPPKRMPPRRPPRPPQGMGADISGPAVPSQALVGYAVADAATGNLVEAQSPVRNFVPGSVQKLFTTWLALETLGPDRTFATELYATGAVKAGVLEGSLILKGGGDPGFAGLSMGPGHARDAIFHQWAVAVAALGVQKVAGCVSGDGSYLEEDGPHPASLWEDAGNYYAGNVSGLCFNDNLYELHFDGNAFAGKPVKLQSWKPRHLGIHGFDNHLTTGPSGSRDSAFILGGFPGHIRSLRGTYPAGRMPFAIKGSLPNPAWTAAQEFREYLQARGIVFTAPHAPACGDSLQLPNLPAPAYSGARKVASHASAPLKDLVRHVNQKSDNNYAAQLLALCGKASGRQGSWRGGLEAMQAWLDKHGFDRKEYHFRDGNGLSRYNWVSPHQVVKLLARAHTHAHAPLWRASLVGGPGSEKKLDRYGPGWSGRLFVKTGTLEGVATLAGYLRADSGKWLAFAILANNYESRQSPNPDARADPQAAFTPMLKRLARQY